MAKINLNSKKGFTLIEILLVVLLIGMLATIAIRSYINSTTTFKFLSAYQQVTSALRTARSDALSNEQQTVNGVTVSPKRYGVCLGSNGVATFADTGSKELKFDLTNSDSSAFISLNVGACTFTTNANGAPEDVILRDKSFNMGDSGYQIYSLDPTKPANNNIIAGSVVVFYESGTGNFSAYDSNGNLLSKSLLPFFSIDFKQKPGIGTLERYIRVYQVSGLAEESTTL